MVRLTDFIITQASSDVKSAGNQISDDLQAKIDQIREGVSTLSESQVPADAIRTVQTELAALSGRVSALPDLLATTATNSVRSAVESDTWHSSPAYIRSFRAIVAEMIAANSERRLELRELEKRVRTRIGDENARNVEGVLGDMLSKGIVSFDEEPGVLRLMQGISLLPDGAS